MIVVERHHDLNSLWGGWEQKSITFAVGCTYVVAEKGLEEGATLAFVWETQRFTWHKKVFVQLKLLLQTKSYGCCTASWFRSHEWYKIKGLYSWLWYSHSVSTLIS